MNKIPAILSVLSLAFALLLSFSACSGSTTASQRPLETETPSGNTESGTSGSTTQNPTNSDASSIVLNEGGADVGTSGAVVENGIVSITKPGSYEISGTTSSGGIVVLVDKTEQVELVLNNVSITNPNGPAIYCDSADKLFITAKEGTVNTLKDGKNYPNGDTGPNAALYCDDDLTIRGSGTLNVIGVFKNGISSKNDIKIHDLTLNVEAVNTGIRGKYSVTVESGTLDIQSGNDGIKSTEEVKEGKGYVEVTGGTITIHAGDDGLQASVLLTVSGGKITVTAMGKVTNAPTENITPGIITEK